MRDSRPPQDRATPRADRLGGCRRTASDPWKLPFGPMLAEFILRLKADGKRQPVLGDRRDQDEVHGEASELRDDGWREHRSGAAIRSDSPSAIVVSGDESAHQSQAKPSPMGQLRRKNRSTVERGPAQGVA